jgi:hypothetical protein
MELRAITLNHIYGEGFVLSDSDEESIFSDSDEESICQPNGGSGDDVQQVRLTQAQVESAVARVKGWLENRWCLSERPSLVESAKADRAEIEELGLVTTCREAASREVDRLEKRVRRYTADIISLPWWDTKMLWQSALSSFDTDIPDMLVTRFWLDGLVDARSIQHQTLQRQYEPSLDSLTKMMAKDAATEKDSESIGAMEPVVSRILRRERLRHGIREPAPLPSDAERYVPQDSRAQETLVRQSPWSTPSQNPHIGPPQSAIEKLRFHINDDRYDQEPVYINGQIRGRIHDHQIEGVRFMWQRLVQEADGGLLFHDMGLGKTMQVITVLVALVEAAAGEATRKLLAPNLRRMRTLVLCPASVVDNWADEIATWAPKTRDPGVNYLGPIVKIQSTMQQRQRHQAIRQWAADVGVLVMGYEMFRVLCQEKDGVGEVLRDKATLVVADEVHRLKSESNIRAFASAIKTPYRLGLTGTPLTNDVMDMYQIAIWASHKPPFGTQESFRTKYDIPICKGSYRDSSAEQKRIAKFQSRRFHDLLRPLVHRMTIEELNGSSELLPGKTEFYLMLRLSPGQLAVYNTYLRGVPSDGSDDQQSDNTMT